jgi:hypothetical protein
VPKKKTTPTCLSEKPQRLEMEFYNFFVEQREVVGKLTVLAKKLKDFLELWKRGSDFVEHVQQFIVPVVVVAGNLDGKNNVEQ